jgi:hypothetical protein
VEPFPGHERAKVERQVPAGGVGVEDRQRHDPEQEQRGPGGRIEEELEGGVDAAVVAPHADEEVHRDEHRFPEHEEQEEVDRHENAHEGGLEGQHQGEVGVDPLRHVGRRQHGDREEQPRQYDHEQADAVDAHQVADAEVLDPGRRLDELVTRHRLVEVDEEGDGQDERHQRDADGDDPDEVGTPGRDGCGRHRPGGGKGEEEGAVGEGHQTTPRASSRKRTTVAPDRSVSA